jgi:hypothetical protein
MIKKSQQIKQYILAKFGGNSAVAGICKVSPAAVSQWNGIPSQHFKILLDAAAEKGLNWNINIFFNHPPKAVKSGKKK